MNRVYVFYLVTDSPNSAGNYPDYQTLSLPGGGVAYVRVELSIHTDELMALDRAEPRLGESVMNTHNLDV